MTDSSLFQLHGIKKSFPRADGSEVLVLDDIHFSMNEGEIVAIIGTSGAGKSTLLRIISGLTRPTSGSVTYRGQKIHQPVAGISMVFQHFALVPWLTVLQNVELGLEALRVPAKERRSRALDTIDMIGLDGFESAFPKELSGGMCQRVGFARALVVDPDILLLDEAFSALDVLTAENLRTDLIDLWEAKQTRIKGILLVTHNIEEALAMADRVVIFGSDPGSIHGERRIRAAHPRNLQDPTMRNLMDELYMAMATSQKGRTKTSHRHTPITLGYRLPDVEISELTGLLESLVTEYPGRAIALPQLAENLHLDADELLPALELLDILQFTQLSKHGITATHTGTLFAQADILEKKEIFSRSLLRHVPLARHIRRVLDGRPDHRADEERFARELEDYLSQDEAERILKTIIEWGRYAEIFAYNYNTRELSLEDPS